MDRLAEFHQYRGLLFSIAYRMLGSVADAEDILQDAFIRWEGARDEAIRSTRAFLVTIVSRLCINHLESAKVQREEYFGQWLPTPVITEPAADPYSILQVDESLSIAFLVVLERLTPVERAVFLLREVFDFEYAEIAKAVGRDEVNCRQILKRAREHVADVRPRFKTSPEKREQLLERFVTAVNTGELDGLVSLLSADAVLHSDGGGKAPAVPNLIHGAEAVARAILGGTKKFAPAHLKSRRVQLNGESAIVAYLEGHAFSAVSLEVMGGRIKSVFILTNPEKLQHLTSQRS